MSFQVASGRLVSDGLNRRQINSVAVDDRIVKRKKIPPRPKVGVMARARGLNVTPTTAFEVQFKARPMDDAAEIAFLGLTSGISRKLLAGKPQLRALDKYHLI